MSPTISSKPEVSRSNHITPCSESCSPRQEPCEAKSSETHLKCSPTSEICMIWGSGCVSLIPIVSSESCNLYSCGRWKSLLAGHQKEPACSQPHKEEGEDRDNSGTIWLWFWFMQVSWCLLHFLAAIKLFPNWGRIGNSQNIKPAKTDVAAHRCLIHVGQHVPQSHKKYRHRVLKKPKQMFYSGIC